MHSNLSLLTHVQTISSKVFRCINSARQLSKYMSKEQRSIFTRSYLTSIIHYGLPLLYWAENQVKTKIHRLTMVCARFAYGNYGYKVRCKELLQNIKLSSVEDEIEKASAMVVNKILLTEEPKPILRLIRMPRTRNKASLSPCHRLRPKPKPHA